MSADLALQVAIRSRLIASVAVTALVPAIAILDRNQRPAPKPSIILGESQVVEERADIHRTRVRVYHTVHIWKTEPSLAGVKEIASAARSAIRSGRMALAEGYHLVDLKITGARFMRDPDGETSHGVMTIDAIIQEPVT